MGESLLVRYCEADQEPGVAEQNRENERRRRKREEYAAAFQAANPDKQFRLTKEQAAECKWSPEGLRVRLRLETAASTATCTRPCSCPHLRDGDRLVLYPRWTVDERLPVAERKEFTPTPKQMLYGQRAELIGIVATEKDESGRVTAAFAEVELKESRWRRLVQAASSSRRSTARWRTAGSTRSTRARTSGTATGAARWSKGLCAGQPNVLYDRLVHARRRPATGPGRRARRRSWPGWTPSRHAGQLHDFEAGKREFIGGHGTDAGPAGPGAAGHGQELLDRLRRLRPAPGGDAGEAGLTGCSLSCKTHAATDVLLKNVLEVREKLRELRDADPELFARYFDARLLDVPLYRVAPNDPPPDGVVHLVKDAEKEKGEDEERRRDPGAPLGRRRRSRPAASTGCSRRSGPRTSSATSSATAGAGRGQPDEPARGGHGGAAAEGRTRR